jgi:hypothetical protein
MTTAGKRRIYGAVVGMVAAAYPIVILAIPPRA